MLDLLLNGQGEIPFKLFKLTSLSGREFIGTELDLDFLKLAGELERHLRIVIVDHWRSGVLAFVEREFTNGGGLLDSIFGDLLAIHLEGSKATSAKSAAIVFEHGA
jgi:hypothetical protein